MKPGGALKRRLVIIGGCVGLLALLALAIPLLVNLNHYKPQLEAAASDALGMEFRVGGRLGMGFFPGFHVTLGDVRVLGAQGAAVASVKRAKLWIAPLPLIARQVRIQRVQLTRPALSVERDTVGTSNVDKLKKKVVRLLHGLEGGSLSLSDGTLHYADKRSGDAFEATGVDLAVSRIGLAGGQNAQSFKGLSFKAVLACGEIRAGKLSLSALKAFINAKDGILELKPVTMGVFDGQATGSLRADVSGPVPLYRLRGSLPSFRIEEFLKTLSPEAAAEGTMDLTANLSMQGTSMAQIVQTVEGDASLRGQELTLMGADLDGALSRFESSQGFNLVDVGAVFFAGPLGLAVTKGYSFASLFKGSGDSSRVHTLVSDWRVEHGVAQAKDVAMATSKNRIALKGGLDFVNGQFADVTVAVIDEKGCATLRQALRGPFGKPEVEKPHILKALSGPIRKLAKQAMSLLPSGPCEVFYSGSVAPPK